MQLKKDKIISSLKKKGFVQNSKKNHIVFDFLYNGKKTAIQVFVSHTNKKTIGAPLIKTMSEEAKLSKEEFLNLINCPLNREEYIKQAIIGTRDNKIRKLNCFFLFYYCKYNYLLQCQIAKLLN